MWEDWKFRSVSPLVSFLAIVLAIWEGGWPIIVTILISLLSLFFTAYKGRLGYIDIIFLGIFIRLLPAIDSIGLFLILTGAFGIIWHLVYQLPIPMITTMGTSSLFTHILNKLNKITYCFS